MAEPALVENYHAATAALRNLPESLVLWDETLRDGEQMPGVHFSPEEKLQIAELLSEIGVPVLNAGSPSCRRRRRAPSTCWPTPV